MQQCASSQATFCIKIRVSHKETLAQASITRMISFVSFIYKDGLFNMLVRSFTVITVLTICK